MSTCVPLEVEVTPPTSVAPCAPTSGPVRLAHEGSTDHQVRSPGLVGVRRTFERALELLRRARKPLVFGCVLTLGGCWSAPRVDVEGVVRDGRTGAPIAGARVSSDSGEATETGADGRFTLPVEEGAAHLTAEAEGLETTTERVAVSASGTPDVVFALGSAPTPPLDASQHEGIACGPGECLEGPRSAQWALSAMSRVGRDRQTQRAECSGCHTEQGFVSRSNPDDVAASASPPADALTCATCHQRPEGGALRVRDTAEPMAGARADEMGAGALCANCHRARQVSREADRAPHASQANLLLGVGASGANGSRESGHANIAGTCVRCHMSPANGALLGSAGGHTFNVRAIGEAGLSTAACSPCHGDVAPAEIGLRDWDGDGVPAPIGPEFDAAIEDASARLRARVRDAHVRGSCGRLAAEVVAHDGRLHLVADDGRLLGDSDGDGVLGARETGTTVNALPSELAGAAWDLAFLRADGSRGVHNPDYTFAILAALRSD